jgi:hypothetical protein
MKAPLTRKSIIARAFELAPQCQSNKVIRATLKREGYTSQEITSHFCGKALRDQLKALRQP